MPFPVDDWQFWVTTALAITALWFVWRTLFKRKKKRRRTNITVGGKRL